MAWLLKHLLVLDLSVFGVLGFPDTSPFEQLGHLVVAPALGRKHGDGGGDASGNFDLQSLDHRERGKVFALSGLHRQCQYGYTQWRCL